MEYCNEEGWYINYWCRLDSTERGILKWKSHRRETGIQLTKRNTESPIDMSIRKIFATEPLLLSPSGIKAWKAKKYMEASEATEVFRFSNRNRSHLKNPISSSLTLNCGTHIILISERQIRSYQSLNASYTPLEETEGNPQQPKGWKLSIWIASPLRVRGYILLVTRFWCQLNTKGCWTLVFTRSRNRFSKVGKRWW